MSREAAPKQRVDEQLVGLLSHPLRLKILVVLIERVAAPKEIATELKAKLSDVSYHVKQLVKLGFIEPVGEERRRGQVAHLYRAVMRPIWSSEEWAELSERERERYVAWVNQLWAYDVARAWAAGTFQARTDAHTSRAPYRVDEQGWRELNEILDAALAASREVEVRSAERLAEAGDGALGIPVRMAMFCIEMPPGEDRG